MPSCLQRQCSDHPFDQAAVGLNMDDDYTWSYLGGIPFAQITGAFRDYIPSLDLRMSLMQRGKLVEDFLVLGLSLSFIFDVGGTHNVFTTMASFASLGFSVMEFIRCCVTTRCYSTELKPLPNKYEEATALFITFGIMVAAIACKNVSKERHFVIFMICFFLRLILKTILGVFGQMVLLFQNYHQRETFLRVSIFYTQAANYAMLVFPLWGKKFHDWNTLVAMCLFTIFQWARGTFNLTSVLQSPPRRLKKCVVVVGSVWLMVLAVSCFLDFKQNELGLFVSFMACLVPLSWQLKQYYSELQMADPTQPFSSLAASCGAFGQRLRQCPQRRDQDEAQPFAREGARASYQ